MSRWREHFRGLVQPGVGGLPSLRLLLGFPVLLLLLGIILVGVSVNGSSSGAFYPSVKLGHDDALIAGSPERTRSDEWNVQTVWALAQVQQGLPVTNETFPGGGMDATLPQDLPRRDWTIAFRPHLLGFLFLDAGRAIAFKWWLPGLALMAAAFCFILTVLPKRPLVAVLLAVGFYFSSFFQWWFLATTFWPVVWALVAMTAIVWAVRSPSVRSRWAWAGVVGYLTVVMAMGIYVPFIVPVFLVVVFFAIATVVERRTLRMSWRSLLARSGPIVTLGVAAAIVTVVWLASKASTVKAFLGTAYPGQRSTPAGEGGLLSVASIMSSSFTQALQGEQGFLGTNSSEASTFFVVGALLLPVGAWIVWRQRREGGAQPWMIIGMAAVTAVFVAFIFLPGWDAIARLLLLDKSTGNRLKIGIGLASFVVLPYVVRYFDDNPVRAPRWLAISIAGAFFVSQSAIAIASSRIAPASLGYAPLWWLIAVAGAVVLYLFGRNAVLPAAALFSIVAVFSSGGVNPLYRGVFDLRETAMSRQVVRLDSSAPGAWVGVGSGVSTAVLLESGVEAFNGFQGAPSRAMWKMIDPKEAFEGQWNRLAGVSWTGGTGEPQVSNPAADQILSTFDACSNFAQRHVKYVLSDFDGLSTTCLSPIKSFRLPHSTMELYRVSPAD
ncbi:MAG: hypothetical protein H7279_00345 [Microbacteriaceae bacterium]|nr:hypothetical protein [Microbacteriaceae bacterium]